MQQNTPPVFNTRPADPKVLWGPWDNINKLTPDQYSDLMKELSTFQRDAFRYNAQVQNGNWDAATDTYIEMRDRWGNDDKFAGMLETLRAPMNDAEYTYDDRMPEFINNFRNTLMDASVKKRTRDALMGIGNHAGTVQRHWDRQHRI